MMKTTMYGIAAFIVMGMMGCGAGHVTLIPDRQTVAAVGAGKKIVLGKFGDNRKANDSFNPDKSDPEHYIGTCFGTNVSPIRKVYSSDPPGLLVKNSIREIFEDAGFKFVDKGDSESIELNGVVENFWISFKRGGSLETEIGFALEFRKDGKVLGRRQFDGELRGVQIGTSFGALSKTKGYMEKTLNQALRQVAIYIATARFQTNVLGLAPDKVLKSGDAAAEGE